MAMRLIQRGIKNNLRLIFVWCGSFLLLCFISSCKGKTIDQKNNQSPHISADTLQNDYAQAFRIIYYADSTQIDILNPENQKIIQTYIISNQPSKKVNHYSYKINRVIALSTTEVGMLRKLHLNKKIVGISNYKRLCHPVDKEIAKEVGDAFNLDMEKVTSLHPDIIFYSGFNLQSPTIKKLKSIHLKPFIIYEWKETTPLGRAEWIKVYGALFHKQQVANTIFEKIKQHYLSIKQKLKHAKSKPTVLSGTFYNDVFNAPAGNSYMAQLLKDANTDYVYSYTKGTGSLSLSLEKIITKNKQAKYWINMSAGSIHGLLQQNSKFKLLDAYKNRKMYSYFNKKDCFWASSAIEPDILLKDLGKIFHPELFANYQLRFYSPLK